MRTDGADPDLAQMWRYLEELSSALPRQEQWTVRGAVTARVLTGDHPTPESIDLLIAVAARELTVEQYQARVLASSPTPPSPSQNPEPS